MIDREDEPEEVLERAGLVEAAREGRVVAGIPDQLLGHLPGLFVG